MRIIRVITALVAAAVVVGAPAAAAAQPAYPPGPPSLTVEPATIALGDTVDIIGENFGPNETVEITVTVTGFGGALGAVTGTGAGVAMVPVAYEPGGYGQHGQDDGARCCRFTLYAETDDEGDFVIEDFKPKRVGKYRFVATGQESGLTAYAVLKVFKKWLPVTGADAGSATTLGASATVGGLALVAMTLFWRRRAARRKGAPQLDALR